MKKIKHEFCDLIPKSVEDGVLYISIPYATAIHKCACGCGWEVVTPIRTDGWALNWDGDTITLTPSIGNWNLPCQSHYFLVRNEIIWVRKSSFFAVTSRTRNIVQILRRICRNIIKKMD
ncbi:MAG: DUF6527 family protein [Thaumarchaeota archaeon]|nr:DUF6527 family protein [Nitrososphaerota archaeon]